MKQYTTLEKEIIAAAYLAGFDEDTPSENLFYDAQEHLIKIMHE